MTPAADMDSGTYSPAGYRQNEYVYIDRPEGEVEYHKNFAYGSIPCETRLRGLSTCSRCPEAECCFDVTHAKVFFENDPEMYWEFKTAAIIDDVYTVLIFYESQRAVQERTQYRPRHNLSEDDEIVSTLIERIGRSLSGNYSQAAVVSQIARIGSVREDILKQVTAWARRNMEPEDFFSIFGAMHRSAKVWGEQS